LLTQEERHRQIAEKREKRKQEQKLKEEEKERQAKEQKREGIRKQTRTKLDNLKNSDIANVMDTRFEKKDSFFVTQDKNDDDVFDEIDPR
jgi:predicted Holliday junction resolvase-like endonuclease